MGDKNHDSKYLTLWLCVISAAAVILVGWVYAMKFNLNKISEEMNKSGQTSDQAVKEFQEMVSGVDNILKQQKAEQPAK